MKKGQNVIALVEEARNRIVSLAHVVLDAGYLNSLKSSILRAAAGTLFLRVGFSALLFLASVVLARLLGAKGYGAYAYVVAWVNLLSTLALMGFDQLIVRETARYNSRSEWGFLRGVLSLTNVWTIFVSSGTAVAAGIIAWLLNRPYNSQMVTLFWIAMVMLPLVTLGRLRQAALQGLHRVVAGQVPQMLLQPALFLLLICMAYVVLHDRITASWAVSLQVAAAAVSFLVGDRQLRKRLPENIKDVPACYQQRIWLRSALPLLFIGGMNVINVRLDAIMLGALAGSEAVGIYVVASRGAELIGFVMLAVNAALAPSAAKFYAAGEIEALQDAVTQSSRAMLFACLPLAFGLIAFGYWFLALFGPEFTKGQLCLRILSVAQFLNISLGPVGLLLIMTGHEREALTAAVISALTNVSLNALLIPRWGFEGAATATAVSILVSKLLGAFLVYRRLGIHSTAAGGRRRQKSRREAINPEEEAHSRRSPH